MRAVVLSLVLLAASASAAAQGPAPSTPDDIVVTGPRGEEAVRNFVDQLGAPVGDESQHARWDQRICPGVAGLRARYAQLLIDRMAQRAFDVGLDVGEPGCRANVLIIVSSNPDDAVKSSSTITATLSDTTMSTDKPHSVERRCAGSSPPTRRFAGGTWRARIRRQEKP